MSTPTILMRYIIFSLSLLALISCSNNKRVEPNALIPLTEKIQVRAQWQGRVGSGLTDTYRVIAPVVKGDSLYANDFEGNVYAFDRETGDVKWRQDLDLEMAAGLGVGDEKLLAASLNGDVLALSRGSGEILWQTNIVSEILAPPQTNGFVVVVQTNDGRLLGLSAESGETLWAFSTTLPLLTLRGTATPQLIGDNLIAGFANGKLAALSAVDGTLYWERRIARPQGRTDIERVVDIDGTPVIDGPIIYTTSYNGTLRALSPSGDTIWSQENSSYTHPVVIDGRVFVTAANGVVKAFDAGAGFPLWENSILGNRKLSPPQNLGGFLMVADFEGYVHVFDSETGAILSRFQVDSNGVRSPMVTADNYLYVLGNDGILSALSVHLIDPEVLRSESENPE